jgi:hypothetical protein
MPNNPDTSLSGKGSEIMLPSRGNPFAGQTDSATPDLSPEEVAALFRESRPAEAVPSTESEPVAFGLMDDAPTLSAASPPAPEAPPLAEIQPVVVAETTMVAEVSTPASKPASADPSAAATVVAAATTTTVAVAGDPPGTRAAAAGGVELRVSSGEIGPRTDVYVRSTGLPADQNLVDLFVPDDKLRALWQEIEALEKEIVSSTGVGRLGKRTTDEFIDRLAAARNLLMNHREQFEEANREVVMVRYRLARIRNTSFVEDRRVISFYLVLLLVLELLSFIALDRASRLVAEPATVVGLPLNTLWFIILWGGVGGIFAAAWSLVVRHVDDYDPQYAHWYYLSPLMALVTGPLIAMLAQVVLPATMLTVTVGQPADLSVNPIVLYILAFVVGFQQNLLLNLLNYAVERIFQMGAAKDKNKPAAPGSGP